MDAELHLAKVLEEFAGAAAEPVGFRQWLVERKLGSGAMGSVYLAKHRTLDRQVALKILRAPNTEQSAKRMIREAQALAKVRHSNVLQVYQVDTSGERAVIELEYVDGTTMRAWQSQPHLHARDIVAAYVKVGEGIAALHAADLLHRDIKPDNLLIDAQGQVKVIDLGLAVALRGQTRAAAGDASPLELQLTAEGAFVGTLGYMAPELILGGEATFASDQFSLAVAIYEALAGVRPFRGDTPESLARAIAAGELTPPREGRRIRWPLRAVLQRALRFDPERRHPSITHFITGLRRILGIRRLAAWLIVGAAGLGASVLFVPQWLAHEDPCADADALLASVWSDSQRGALLDRAAAHEVERASITALVATLDRRSAAWRGTAIAVCATRGAPLLEPLRPDPRKACLNQVAHQSSNLLSSTLATPSARAFAELSAALESLPNCEDPGPSSGSNGDVLTEALAREIDGDYTGAEALVRSTLADPSVDAWWRAEAHFRLGHVLGMARHGAASIAALDAARADAFSSGHDELFCRATAFMAKVTALVEREPDRAHAELELAHACVERVGAQSPSLRAELLEAEGLLAEHIGDLPLALARHESALELRRTHFGDRHPDTATSLHNLANVRAQSEDPALHDAAGRDYDACIELRRTLGASHPELGDVLFDHAIFLLERGDLELARSRALEALEIHRAAGTSSIIRIRAHMLLAKLELEAAQLDAARMHLDVAIAARDAGAEIPLIDLARLDHLDGIVALRRGEAAYAAGALRRAQRHYDAAVANEPADFDERLDAVLDEIEACVTLRDDARIAALIEDWGHALPTRLASLDDESAGLLAWWIGDSLTRTSPRRSAPYLELALAAYARLGDDENVRQLREALESAATAKDPSP